MDSALIILIITIVSGAMSLIFNKIFEVYFYKMKHNDEKDDKSEDMKAESFRKIKETVEEHSDKFDENDRQWKEQREVNKLLLTGMTLVTGHLVDGNHNDALKKYSDDTQAFLINRMG